jgi:uncharacterized protein YjdB
MIWNADFTNKGNPAWNAGFDKAVPDGAAGNQAQLGIFFEDYKGVIQRLTEAEGHERGFNPDTVERNPIGQEAPSTEIRAYNLTFAQDGDYTIGVMERTDTSTSDESTFTYGFTSSRQIAITGITTSKEEVATTVGGQARVAVSFSPLGCPFDFKAESSDEAIAVVSRWNQSVDIRGRGAGTATITVTSTSDPAATAEIEVTVS